MTTRACFLLGIFGLSAGCATAPVPVPVSNPLAAELETRFDARCFAQSEPQEVTTIVTEQVLVQPARTSPDGSITFPPVFRNADRPVTEFVATGVEFETLCPEEFTPARVSTLQRALKARLAFSGPITGVYDTATQQAVQAFQKPSGFDSPQIARAIAVDLGVVSLPGT